MSTTDQPKTKRLGYCDEVVVDRVELPTGSTIGFVYGTDRFGTELRIAGDWRMIMAIEEALQEQDAWAEDDIDWADDVVVQVPDYGVNVIKAVYVPIDWQEGDPV